MSVSCILMTGCAQTTWYRPPGKSVPDAYADKNACVAETMRVTGRSSGSYFDDCMRAKGYKLDYIKPKTNKDNE